MWNGNQYWSSTSYPANGFFLGVGLIFGYTFVIGADQFVWQSADPNNGDDQGCAGSRRLATTSTCGGGPKGTTLSPTPWTRAGRRGQVSDDTRERTPAAEMYRRIDEAVIDMINEFRIQRAAGPLPDKALDQIVFRAAHSVVQVLAPYNHDERSALWPSVLRMLLASFIREIGIADTMPRAAEGGEGQEEKSDGRRGQ